MILSASECLRNLKNSTKLIRKRPLYRFKIFLNYLFSKKTRKSPVFILATRRSGSNLLLGYLNSIPGAQFLPEILNCKMLYGLRAKAISKRSALRHILHSIYSTKTALCGAKFLRVQMKAHKLTSQDLHKLFPDARYIIIYRESILEQFVSLKIAEKTNAWQWSDKFRLPASIFVDVEELRRFASDIKLFYENLLSSHWIVQNGIFLSYEELVADAQRIFEERIFPFLNLRPVPVSSSMRKQNIKKLSEIIQNYAEIKLLEDEPFLWFRPEVPGAVSADESRLVKLRA